MYFRALACGTAQHLFKQDTGLDAAQKYQRRNGRNVDSGRQ